MFINILNKYKHVIKNNKRLLKCDLCIFFIKLYPVQIMAKNYYRLNKYLNNSNF